MRCGALMGRGWIAESYQGMVRILKKGELVMGNSRRG
jgi:hypothetical protein